MSYSYFFIPAVAVGFSFLFFGYLFYKVGIYEVLFPKEKVEIRSDIKDEIFEADEIKVHFRSVGDNSDRSLVFIHGWGSPYDTRDNILSVFSDYKIHAIVLELPGLDRSSTPKEAWTDYDYADFVHSFVTEKGLRKPVIVGQSFGGGIASAYAEKYPEDLEVMVLVDANTSNKTSSYKSAVKWIGNSFSYLLASKVVPFKIKDWLITIMLTVPKNSLNESSYDGRKTMGETFILTHAEDKLERLKNIETPTLLVWGAWDRKIPIERAREMDSVLSHSKLLLVDGGGHTVIYRKPKSVVDLIMMELEKTNN